MKRSNVVDAWLDRAESDLLYAKAGERETKQHHITCFLCQQVAEKGLKALLVLAGTAPERTHHLGRLASLAVTSFPTLTAFVPSLRRLDKYYTTARYPDDISTECTAADAREALRIAESVLQWIFTQTKK